MLTNKISLRVKWSDISVKAKHCCLSHSQSEKWGGYPILISWLDPSSRMHLENFKHSGPPSHELTLDMYFYFFIFFLFFFTFYFSFSKDCK